MIVLCAPDQQPFVLAGTGLVLWELLDEPVDEDELIAQLAHWYELDTGFLAREVRPFLEELAQTGAVREL